MHTLACSVDGTASVRFVRDVVEEIDWNYVDGDTTSISGYTMNSEKRTGGLQAPVFYVKQPDGSLEQAKEIENIATLEGSFSISAP